MKPFGSNVGGLSVYCGSIRFVGLCGILSAQVVAAAMSRPGISTVTLANHVGRFVETYSLVGCPRHSSHDAALGVFLPHLGRISPMRSTRTCNAVSTQERWLAESW